MNKRRYVISVIFLIVILSLIVLWFTGENDDTGVKLNDNVYILDSEVEVEFHPISVTEETIVFDFVPQYKSGDIIVSGMSEVAPSGFIRKIISVSEMNGIVTYQTENAGLIDVFEEAHVVKVFAITESDVWDIQEYDDDIMSLGISTEKENFLKQPIYMKITNSDANVKKPVEVKPSKDGVGIVVEIEDEIRENLEIKGEVKLENYLELKLDIEDNEVEFGMALHTDTNGEIFLGCQKELFDKDGNDDVDGEYEKKLVEKSLPNVEFMIGIVPVVITNAFEMSIEVSAQLEGEIGTTVGVSAERVTGFEYSSREGIIKEINERKYISDGVKWDTRAKAEGELETGIYVHLISKLYDSTGTDLSVGIAGDVRGEVALGINEKLEPVLYGNVNACVRPNVNGKLVVETPIIDKYLEEVVSKHSEKEVDEPWMEAEILKVKLPAFWENEWRVADPMLSAMQKGNFSCFAGKYIATQEDNDTVIIQLLQR